MRRDFVGEGEPATVPVTGACVSTRCDGRVEWTPVAVPSQRVTSARSVRACTRALAAPRERIDEDLFERAHRGGAGFDRAISCDFELPPHRDGAVGRLGRRGGLPREHRAGGRLSVDRVRLARGSTQTPIDSIHFHDPMTRAVDRTGQADAVAAGPFNADGLDATIRLGPGEQRSIPLRIGTERVGAQADAPAIDRHRDVHVLVGIDPDNHRLRFVQVRHAVRHCRLRGLRRRPGTCGAPRGASGCRSESGRPRRTRRAAGKSDTLDAEVAARSVLAGQSTAIPKTADGAVEMMRQLKITRDTAVKARTTAMNTLKQIVVHAPPALREALHDLTDHGLLTRCAGLRPGPIDTPTASAKYTLRALARRWMALTEEMAIHDQHLARLTTETSPTLREGFGVGAHTAAELLIVFGDNPDRIRSDAAFAKRYGACPLPASSGMTTGRHRLNRGGHRHANAALYRAVIVRMQYHQPTVDDVARRTADGRTKREIIRCLKRFLAREIYQRVMTDFRARQELIQAA